MNLINKYLKNKGINDFHINLFGPDRSSIDPVRFEKSSKRNISYDVSITDAFAEIQQYFWKVIFFEFLFDEMDERVEC